MADIQDVITLLERWRDASGVSRLGVAVDATRAIRGLSPTAKRELAAEVAARVAPQLVPQIRAEQGDLTSEQVTAVVDLIRRADDQQLTDLVTALRTGDVDGGLSIVEEAVETVAPAVPAGVAAASAAQLAELDEQVDDAIDDAVDALRDPPPAPPAAPEADDGPTPDATVDVDVDEAVVRAEVEAAAAARAERWKDSSRSFHRPAYEMPHVSFTIDLDDDELPDPTVEELAPLEQRRHALPGAVAAATASRPRDALVLGDTTGAPARAPTPPPTGPGGADDGHAERLAAVLATPDGYRRRRAALAALADGALGAHGARQVVTSLGRVTDRAWVLGAAIDDRLLGADALDGLGLPATTVRRLRARLP